MFSELIAQRHGHGDQRGAEGPTPLQPLQAHLQNILLFHFAPAHFHTAGGIVVVVSDLCSFVEEVKPWTHMMEEGSDMSIGKAKNSVKDSA